MEIMDLGAILVFAAVLAVATATPGPTVAVLVARVLALGSACNLGFAVGLVLGDVVWLAAAVFGLAAVAEQAHEIMAVLKYLGAGYLIYLACKMWTAPAASPAQGVSDRKQRLGPVVGGLAMAISNPKTMLFYLALLPNLVPLADISLATFAELVALLTVVYSAVLAAYMISASYARRLITSPRTVRYANRGSAVVMAGTAAIVAGRS
jgi:threonine/homoserine/homoserine lactone efflux protein